jgi:hypothetical protein
MRLYLLLLAARTPIHRYQFTLLHIKLLCLVYHPLVMSVATQYFPLVLLLLGRLLKRDDLSHSQTRRRYSSVRCRAESQDLKRLRRAAALMTTENSRSARQIFFISAGLCHRPTPRPAR